jgi:hypothetical protein
MAHLYGSAATHAIEARTVASIVTISAASLGDTLKPSAISTDVLSNGRAGVDAAGSVLIVNTTCEGI